MKLEPEKSSQEVLAGLIERVTYHNAENGFCVLRAKARGHASLQSNNNLSGLIFCRFE
jgi:exodeoxyribonuclease V alpha subunit